jgi:hypothetical protein
MSVLGIAVDVCPSSITSIIAAAEIADLTY